MRIHIPSAGLKRKFAVGGLLAMPILGVGGAAYAATVSGGTGAPAPAVNQPVSNNTQGADAPGVNETPDTPGASSGAETPPGASGADGAGGHQDPGGADVNHQFDGQE